MITTTRRLPNTLLPRVSTCLSSIPCCRGPTLHILPPPSCSPTRSFLTHATRPRYEPAYTLARKSNSNNKGGKGGKGGKGDEEEGDTGAEDVDLSGIQSKMEATLNSYVKEVANYRAGKASPDLLDKVVVNVKGKEAMLSKVATVSVKDPLTLLVNVFDESVCKYVEAGIKDTKSISMLDLTVSNEGNGVVKVVIPKPTQDFRQTLIKNSSKAAEQAKVIVRKHRKDAMDLAKKHKLSKDEERKFDIKVQGITDDWCKKIDAAYNLKDGPKNRNEIRTVLMIFVPTTIFLCLQHQAM